MSYVFVYMQKSYLRSNTALNLLDRCLHIWSDALSPIARFSIGVDCQSSWLLVMSVAPKVYPLAQVPLTAHAFNAARTRAMPLPSSGFPLFLTSIINRCRCESELERGYYIQLSRK